MFNFDIAGYYHKIFIGKTFQIYHVFLSLSLEKSKVEAGNMLYRKALVVWEHT